MAEISGRLEDMAKGNSGDDFEKQSVCLFELNIPTNGMFLSMMYSTISLSLSKIILLG